jgi:uncharacterized protein involved in type VI secretion and phage assembly
MKAPTTIVAGIVEDLDDPEDLGRVRVTFPHLDGVESYWARLVSAGAGKDRGTFFRPERGDEVMLAFEHGDMRRAYVLGGVWNKPDPPPESGDRKANDVRQIVSRAGHRVTFIDTAGSERIEIVAAGGAQMVTIDRSKKRIEVKATEGDVVVTAAGNVEVESTQNVTIKAEGNIDITASGKLRLRGATVDIN